MGELMHKLNTLGIGIADARLTPDALAGLITLADAGAISGPTAKAVFEKMYESGRSAEEIVRAEGLGRIDDTAALERIVKETLDRHPEPAAQYRAGKTTTLGFLVGQVMRVTGGKANPTLVSDLLRRELKGED